MEVSKTQIVSLVSQTGDEYFALLLVPYGRYNRIALGRGATRHRAGSYRNDGRRVVIYCHIGSGHMLWHSVVHGSGNPA